MTTPPRPDVILVGRRLPDNENLGLGCLLGALRDAEIPSEMQPLGGWPDLPRIAARVAEVRPRVVGLSLPDGGSSLLALGLGELLAEEGYPGAIVAGGGFATLARHWLLERYGWLDAVVRHAGEVPLVAVAQRARAGRAGFDRIAGVTTRAGDGEPAPVMDETALRVQATRGELPQILGRRAAHVAASRGCPGCCAYCGPAALQDLERAEARAGGHDPEALRACGIGRTRRRPMDALCDEMAALWHDRDVRYFYFVDEQLVPRRADDARSFLGAWRDGLRARGVGPRGIGCMTRSDLLGPDVLPDLLGLGLVRAFVGIELATPGELRTYGRAGDPARGMQVMHALDEARVATVCNVMLVHPESTPETVAQGIGFMEHNLEHLFEATQMQVYHGTRLWDRLRREGRLLGNPLRYGYAFCDSTTARFTEVLARLRGEAFLDYSVAFGVHDLRLALSLGRRLEPDLEIDDLWARSAALTREMGRTRVEALRAALALAEAGGGYAEAGEVVERARARLDELRDEIEALGDVLAARTAPAAPLYRPLQSVAASVITFVLAGATLTGAGVPARADVPPVPEPPTPAMCTEEVTVAQRQAVVDAVKAVDPCRDYVVTVPAGGGPPTLETLGSGTMRMRAKPPEKNLMEEEVARAVGAVDTRCLVGTKVSRYGGAAHQQLDTLFSKAVSGCYGEHHSLVIELDQHGRVLRVTTQKQGDAEADKAARCVHAAALGMTFPCLAGYTVMPEYVIIE